MLKQTVAVLPVVLAALIAWAGNSDSPLDANLSETTARGRMLAEYDAAIFAIMPSSESVESYVATKTNAGWVVAFGHLNGKRDKFFVVCESTQGSSQQGFTLQKFDPPLIDTGFYLAGAKAIETALRDFRGESPPHNALVLPATSSQLYVYILPAQRTARGNYPLGGDVRYLVSSDGNTIIEKRQLHKANVVVGYVQNSRHSVSGHHTHSLSDVPEDTDVFFVLRRNPRVPEVVTTRNHVYVVELDGTIIRKR